jgi:eukaryotic-like serine/threonine-protein kinase
MSVSARRRRTSVSRTASDSTVALAQRLADELAQRWTDGQRPQTEEYLARFPKLADLPDAALELIYEEMCQEQQSGRASRPSTWLRRFPQWRQQIELLLACHDLLEMAGAGPWFPEPGQTFGDFELLDQFGQGAHGRVYLARQPSLADRPVVLKLASLAGQEHISLARLQHTYIMPLYWADDDAATGLRVLCMPYFGGTSLSQLLSQLADVPPVKRTGRDLHRALSAACELQKLSPAVQGPACEFLEQATYVEAICTLGACLAEALDYAHQRNVIHHDLKPSNVLIAADGQPLLLDFHLAQPALDAGSVSISWLGGTPGYMAPEHEAALAAMRAKQPTAQRLDGKADVFSLGVLLCEALTDRQPPANEPLACWLRRMNNQVSPALAALLARCLVADPSKRYPNAGAVASDLRRHLAQQPLAHVANRSVIERWRKWRRRRPYALMATSLVVAFATACYVITATHRQHSQEAQRALGQAETEMEERRYESALAAADRGLDLAADLLWHGELWQKLQSARSVANKGLLAEELNDVASRLRDLYAEDDLLLDNADQLELDARRLWEKRSLLLNGSVADHYWSQEQVADDLGALAIFWADLHLRRARRDELRAAAQEGLSVLAEAERLTGATLILCREQERLARLAGKKAMAALAAKRAEALVPASPWEHYALGRTAFAAGDFREADIHFRAAVEAKPREFRPNFYHGRAAYELKQYDEAVTAFSVCVALSHQAPSCYYYRGLASVQLGLNDAARRDFDRALELDPHYSAAALDRGMLSYKEQRYDEALADLELASSSAAPLGQVAYGLALVYAAQRDRASALEQLEVLFTDQPDHEGGQKLAEFLRQDNP